MGGGGSSHAQLEEERRRLERRREEVAEANRQVERRRKEEEARICREANERRQRLEREREQERQERERLDREMAAQERRNQELREEAARERQRQQEAERRRQQEIQAANERARQQQEQMRQKQERQARERRLLQQRMEQQRIEAERQKQRLLEEERKAQERIREEKRKAELARKQQEEAKAKAAEEMKKQEQLTQSMKALSIEQDKYKLEALNLEKRCKQMEGAKPDESVDVLRQKASRLLGVDTVNKVNIGFCGAVKTGKSSLINALRHVHPDQPGAAAVGSLETTKKIKGYTFPEDNKLVFWDIPGSDVQDFNRQTCFYQQHLYVFDFLMVLSRGALTETELLIAEHAHKYSIPFTIARSRCDEDLHNEKRIKRTEIDVQMKERLRQNVRQNYLGQMPNSLRGVVTDLYCVSSRALEDMNEGKVSKFELDETKLLNYIQKQIRSQRYTLKK